MNWLATTNANNFKQTYIAGFLDVSGDIITRKNGITAFADSSFNSNLRITKTLNIDDTTFSGRMVVNNSQNTNLNASTKMHVNGISEYLGNLNILNNASTAIQFGGIAGGSITSKINDTGNGGIVLAGSGSISLNANSQLTDAGDLKILPTNIEIRKPIVGISSGVPNTLFILSDMSLNGNLYVVHDISGLGNLNINGNANINGNINGNTAIFTSPITLPNKAQPIYSVIVSADSSFNSNLFINNNLNVKNAFISSGDTSLNSTKMYGCTYVYGKSYFAGDMSFGSSVLITGNTFISSGDTSLNSTKMYGCTYVYGKSYFVGDMSLGSSVLITGNTFISSGDTSLNSTKMYGCTYVYGKSYFSGDISNSETAYLNKVDINGNVLLRNGVVSNKNMYANSSVYVDVSAIVLDLSVNQTAQINNLNCIGNAQINTATINTQFTTLVGALSTFNGNVVVAGNIETNGVLNVNGEVVFRSSIKKPVFMYGLQVNSGISEFADISVNSGNISGKSITAIENIFAGNANIYGNINSGNAFILNNIDICGNLISKKITGVNSVNTQTIYATNSNISNMAGLTINVSNDATILGNIYANQPNMYAEFNNITVGNNAQIYKVYVDDFINASKIIGTLSTTTNTLDVSGLATLNNATITNTIVAPTANINILNGNQITTGNINTNVATINSCDICGNLMAINLGALNSFTNTFICNDNAKINVGKTSRMYGMDNVYLKNVLLGDTDMMAGTNVMGNLTVNNSVVFGGNTYYTFENSTATITFGGSSNNNIFNVLNAINVISFWININSLVSGYTNIVKINDTYCIQIDANGMLQVFGISMNINKNKWVLLTLEYNTTTNKYNFYINREISIYQQDTPILLSNTSPIVINPDANSSLISVRNMKILYLASSITSNIIDDLYIENDTNIIGLIAFHFPLTSNYINVSTNKILTINNQATYATYSGLLKINTSTFTSNTTNNIYKGAIYINGATVDQQYKLNVLGNTRIDGNAIITGNINLSSGNITGLGNISTNSSTFKFNNNSNATLIDINATRIQTNLPLTITPSITGENALIINGNVYANGISKFIKDISMNGNAQINGNLVVGGDISTLDAGFKMRVNGKITAEGYNAYSDRRLKTNITPMDKQWNKIKEVMPVSFNWIDTSKNDVGFIAQDIFKTYPVFSGQIGEEINMNPVDENGVPIYMSIDYGKMTCILWKGLREALEVIDTQNKEIEQINKRIQLLENIINNK